MKAPSLFLPPFVLLLCGSMPVFGADVIDASLRLRFNFDAAPVSNVIVDSSPSATHPGTNFGATWSPSENGHNGVMDFKAPIANRITVPAIPALNSSVGTISFWVKTPGNLVRGDYAAMLVDRRTGDGDVITLTDTGTIFVQARAGGANANSFSAGIAINDNNWHHVAYVYDQSAFGGISIYIDGALDTFQQNSQPWSWPANQPLELGSSHDGYWRVFVGLMDDFQIHNRMLSASEVAATFAGNPVLDNSLVERLDFAAAPVNNVVVDSSSSGNSATNQGCAWVSADGARNGLMRFDLSFNQITVASEADFNSATGTIAFWMKSSGNIGPGDFASVIFDRRLNGNGDVITMKDDGTIFVQAEASWNQVNTFATQAKVNDGQWHHVAYVYDQSDVGSIRLYIDGSSSGFQSNSAAWAWPPDQQLELALSHDGYWFGFDGALDDFRFYNRQLSAEEVGRVGVAPTLRFDVQPASQSVFAGDDVVFTTLANMTASYQWRFSGTNLTGSTDTTLLLTNVQAAQAGAYTVVASNASFGMVTSTPAILTINQRPSLSASLVARYNFDAAPVNEVIADSSPRAAHPGTNLLATWAASVSGRSGVMQFTSADPGTQIVIPPHADFNTSKGTIAFWLKSPGNGVFGDYGAMLVDRRSGFGDVIVMKDDGTLFVQAYNDGFNINSFSTVATVNNDQWHHVAYVYDQGANGSIRLYVDGQLAGSNPNSLSWSWDPAEQIELGKSHDSFWRRLDGYLDDVQFYNRTLSTAEIAESMTLGPLGPIITFTRSGNQLTLIWGQSGFVLQETSDLSNPNGWADVSGAPVSPATVTISPGINKFYRVRKPL